MTQPLRAAIYGRFSTDKQSKDSVEDQLRVCQRLAEREGLQVVTQFSDAAISGGTPQRPGYQLMLAGARRREFDVIVAEDTSRLWRNMAEQAPRLAELSDLGVRVLTHDLDSLSESAGMLSAVLGASAEAYRREIARRTRRGLEGLARRGRPTGGKSYGYRSVEDPSGERNKDGSIARRRAVDAEQAKVVRWIFEQYALGMSTRRIAIALNEQGIPSPGAAWRRTRRRRDAKWLDSSINSQLLDNPLYAGTVIWGRVSMPHTAQDSHVRIKTPKPESQWVSRQDESLRIIPQELWDRVRARRANLTAGNRLIKPAPNTSRRPGARGGKALKYPLSGLLVCGQCGGSFAMADVRAYCCSSNRNGGMAACREQARIPKERLQEIVLDTLRGQLLTPARLERYKRRVAAGGRKKEEARGAQTHAARRKLEAAERVRDNIMTAIKAGIFTPTTKAELMTAEAAVTAARSAVQAVPEKEVTLRAGVRAVAELEQMVAALPAMLGKDADRAREILRRVLGTVRLVRQKEGLFAELSTSPERLLPLASANGSGGRIQLPATEVVLALAA